MSVKPELLNRGLWSIIDPSMMPDGALQEATNARYHPGDPAIFQAEGRAAAGSNWSLISGVAPLVWDIGTVRAPGKPELKQILYVIDNSGLVSVPAVVDPANPALNLANSSVYPIAPGASIGPNFPVTVQFKNAYYILTGGKTVVMFRQNTADPNTTGQFNRRSGFPIQVIPVSLATTGGDFTFKAGFHFFWFTWFNPTSNQESDADVLAAGGYFRTAGSVTGGLNVLVDIATFDAAVPPGAAGIRIYKSLPFYPDLAISTKPPPANAWPVGYRIPNVPTPTLTYIPFVSNTNGARFAVSGTNYVLTQYGATTSPSTSENENHLSDFPLFAFGTVSVGGIQVNFGLNGEPPASNTGDVFEESLVTNDLGNRRQVRFSMPNNADQFPAQYFIPFDTSETDEILAIRRLGNKLGVFLRQGVWRVEWLPNQSEFDFSRGRVMDEVQGAQGVIGEPHYCVTKFTMPGQGPMLAWVARTGYVYATNLYDVTKLCPQFCLLHFPQDTDRIKFADMPLDNVKIFDDPDNERLVVQTDAFLWYLHYDEAHIHDGALDVTGPVYRPNGISAYNAVTLENNKRQLVSISTAKKPFYEAIGATDDGLALNTSITTREIYPFGMGEEMESESFFVHSKPSGGDGTITLTVKSSTELSDVNKANTFQAGARALKNLPLVSMLERYTLNLTVHGGVATPIAINYIGLEVDEERQKLS